MKRNRYVGAVLVLVLVVLGATSYLIEKRSVVHAATAMAPKFEVDPLWPKPLPNHWILGQTIGVSVDAQDHVWIIHRAGSLEDNEKHATTSPQTAQCCAPAPPILEFDQQGNLLRHWGGPGNGYDWPESNHGITVDYKGNVWIGGNSGVAAGGGGGRGKQAGKAKGGDPTLDEGQTVGVEPYNDNMVLKFTQDGKFLMQIGKPGRSKGSNDPENLRRPAKIFVDQQTNEAFIADGYGNHRVIVYDAETGKYKRHWGAYGKKPDDGLKLPSREELVQGARPEGFNNPVHAVVVTNDDLVYVADRSNNRLQVFKLDGTFVREVFISRNTLQAEGTVHGFAVSPDKDQRFLYVVDGSNKAIRILNRQTLDILASVGGHAGHNAREFFHIHSVASDSKGNLFLGEVNNGQRYYRYAFKGMSK